jgi:Leucine-rich repeat (LRR) protein
MKNQLIISIALLSIPYAQGMIKESRPQYRVNEREVSISGRDLTNLRVLKNIADASKITELDLMSNHIASIEKDAFDGLPNLERLYLHANNLTDLKKDFFESVPVTLKRLGLSNNGVKTIEPGAFDRLVNLEVLQLDGNELTFLDPALVANLKRLKVLNLRGNNLTPENKEAIKALLPNTEVAF